MSDKPAARLIYKNETPEILAWSADVLRRSKLITEERHAWMKAIYDAAGVPDPEEYDSRVRSAWVSSSGRFTGMSWPRKMDDKLPAGWFRPVKDPHLVRPKREKRNRAVWETMTRLSKPNQRAELEKFGMHGRTFAGMGLYECGIHHEDDAVWVTWASADVADEKWAHNLGEHGWVRVSIVDYIQKFGEGAL